jgi:hypothetical protein
MELVFLALVTLTVVLIFAVVALQLLWWGAKLLVLLPLKLFGALLGGAVGLILLPVKLLLLLLLLAGLLVGLVLLPLFLPVLVICGVVYALAACCW